MMMSKESLTKILEGALSLLKRIVLFLTALIGLIDPTKKKTKAKKVKDAGTSK